MGYFRDGGEPSYTIAFVWVSIFKLIDAIIKSNSNF